MQKLRTWLGDVYRKASLWHTKDERFTSRLIARMAIENGRLKHQLLSLEAEKRTMRDSVLEHMAYENKLREEISSLKRHLHMAIEERDEARKRKRSA